MSVHRPQGRSITATKPRLAAAELNAAISRAGLSIKEVSDVYPLSPLQQGILFHSLYEEDAAVYVATQSWRIRGALDTQAFERAWGTLLKRHTILRTAFIGQDLEPPLQAVLRSADFPFESHDWRDINRAQQGERLTHFLKAESIRRFDLVKPPLMRLCLIRTEEYEHRLLWSSHHLLLDAWSEAILLREF